MDFGARPPEVNSAAMYTGPGSASMLIAAAAWEETAEELSSAASSCNAAISALAGAAWVGQAAVAMTTAAAPYLTWLSATADTARLTAAQLRRAAGAFDTAFAATVPPPLIAANRASLMLLTATNVLGANTPAIAAAEAHYWEMWAQDASAMYSYAAASAAASTLTTFTSPAEIVDPAGPLVFGASGNSGFGLTDSLDMLGMVVAPTSSGAATMSSSMSAMSSLSSVLKTLGSLGSGEAEVLDSALSGDVSAGLSALPPGLFVGLSAPESAVSAALGRAVSLGPLSVPASWASAAAAHSGIAASLSGTRHGAGSVLQTSGMGNMLGGLPVAGMVPRGEGGLGSATTRPGGVRHTVMPRPEFGG